MQSAARRSRSPRKSHTCIFHRKEVYYFLPRHHELCGCFLDEFTVPSEDFCPVFLYSYTRWFMLTVRGEIYWPNHCKDRETQSVSFPLQRFRDGRDYGRITLRNMDAPNQIKAKTIKARVKATAVSSFKCLPPPPQLSKSVTLNSTVSIPNLSTSGADISPFCMNTGQWIVRT